MSCAFAQAANAQSTVTLYGIVDAGVLYTNNREGHSSWELAGGNESGPRWGLMGSEDLGGGMKANFRLENGFNVANGALGQGGRMFGRQAWVGLSGTNWGAVTLGFAGLQANLVYGFSNVTGFADDNSWSADLTYANGPVNAGAAYARMNHPALSASGAVASDNYYPASASVFGANLANTTRQQIWGAGGTCTFGQTTFELLYTGTSFEMPAGGALRFNNYEGSLRYMLTPALMAMAGYTYTQVARGDDDGHYHQVSAGLQYLLSKRTDVYVNGFYQKASSGIGSAWIDGTSGPSSTTSQVAIVAGIREKF